MMSINSNIQNKTISLDYMRQNAQNDDESRDKHIPKSNFCSGYEYALSKGSVIINNTLKKYGGFELELLKTKKEPETQRLVLDSFSLGLSLGAASLLVLVPQIALVETGLKLFYKIQSK